MSADKPATSPTASKAGTFDIIIRPDDGDEIDVFILEDTAAKMVLRVIETGQILTLAKAVQ